MHALLCMLQHFKPCRCKGIKLACYVLSPWSLQVMPRKATGSLVERSGTYYARVWVSDKERKQIALRGAKDRDYAKWLAETLALMIRSLRDAKQDGHIPKTVELVSKATSKERVEEIAKIVDGICSGELVDARAPSTPTFRDVAEQWTSGEVAEKYPEHARFVSSMSANEQRLRDYILPFVGDIEMSAFAIGDALRVLEHLPKRLAPATRRHVSQIMYRVCALAVWPLRLIAVSPLPKGFVPKKPKPKARAFLFPDEEAKLLANTNADLQLRVLVGFLNREGLRKGEAATLEWSDLRGANARGWINLEKGWLYLDKNKTGTPRDWRLSEGVCEALKAWRQLSPRSRFVFPNGEDDVPVYTDKLAAQFRDLVRASGIDRSELFDSNQQRQRINAHDMRGIFVTTSLARGETEGWVMSRTGHTTSSMLQKYRRHAANLEEAGKAQLIRLDEAIPELSALRENPNPSSEGGDSGENSGEVSQKAMPNLRASQARNHLVLSKEVRRKGLEPSCLSTLEPKDETKQAATIHSTLRESRQLKSCRDLAHIAVSEPNHSASESKADGPLLDALSRVIVMALRSGNYPLALALVEASKKNGAER